MQDILHHGDERNHCEVVELGRTQEMATPDGQTVYRGPMSAHTYTTAEKWCRLCGWQRYSGIIGKLMWHSEHDDH